mmetsp:Transcript_35569/g.60115  ORF Transcript_35569/g.60115 Transcript_35569/m.60115 type:complete len:252 (-) Transcript_35569:46-801(-)
MPRTRKTQEEKGREEEASRTDLSRHAWHCRLHRLHLQTPHPPRRSLAPTAPCCVQNHSSRYPQHCHRHQHPPHLGPRYLWQYCQQCRQHPRRRYLCVRLPFPFPLLLLLLLLLVSTQFPAAIVAAPALAVLLTCVRLRSPPVMLLATATLKAMLLTTTTLSRRLTPLLLLLLLLLMFLLLAAALVSVAAATKGQNRREQGAQVTFWRANQRELGRPLGVTTAPLSSAFQGPLPPRPTTPAAASPALLSSRP